MNTPRPDLGDLLHDAVDDIEPADRIDAIRARTASPAHAAARPWFYAAGGVVLATAATVAAFAVLSDSSGPAGHHDHDAMATPTPGTQLVAAYFVGDTAHGVRLFREFDQVVGDDALQAALDRIQRPPSDPDYRSAWPARSFAGAEVRDGTIDVELGDAGQSVTGAVETSAAQQLAYTVQAAVGARLPVQLVRDGEPVGEPITAQPQRDVLNLVMINDPTEGAAAHGVFTARGAADSFEANVPWEIRDDSGAIVRKGFATAAGTGDRLYPWEARVVVRGLPYGFYTFVAMTDDPSDGEAVTGPFTDTRTIVVR